MGKPSHLVRNAANRLMDHWRTASDFPMRLPAEAELAVIADVSRTTVRKILTSLDRRGLVARHADGLWLKRAVTDTDRYRSDSEPVTKAATVEAAFYDQFTRRQWRAGDRISELKLATSLGTTTAPVREALARISRFGLLKKQARRQWEVVSLDTRMIDALFDLRELLEAFALERALALKNEDPAWSVFRKLLKEHQAAARAPLDPVSFGELDTRFHQALIATADNPYVSEMLEVIVMTIHFQLRDDAVGAQGLACALVEHPAILEALLARDTARARAALSAHLTSARRIMHRAGMTP